MSTIKERSEVNSLASTPLLTYSEPSSPPTADLYLNLSEPSLENIDDEVRRYIHELKGNLTDMKNHIEVQNRYISDLTMKYEDSLDTIVELNTKIHQLEQEVQSWRVKAKSQELSSSMLEHDVNELRDTIVLLRRENIEIIEHTPLLHPIDHKSEVKLPEQTTYSKPSKHKKERKSKIVNEIFDLGTMPRADCKGLSTESYKKSVNATPLLQKRFRKIQSRDIPDLNLDFRSIRQRPIDPVTSPFDTRLSFDSLNSKRLPILSTNHDLSQASRHPVSRQFRKSTPRPSSLTDTKTNGIVYSKLELTSSKCIPSPRNKNRSLNQSLSQTPIIKGTHSRRPYT